ncbi:MAG TPA: hypothetical protein PLO50_02860 [Nitrospira sp.]|nr:hypothetical protein [Nitrospira sp.]
MIESRDAGLNLSAFFPPRDVAPSNPEAQDDAGDWGKLPASVTSNVVR